MGVPKCGASAVALSSKVDWFCTRCPIVTLDRVHEQGEIHPAIVTLGRKYASGEVTGATARAVAMLVAFKHVVMDYATPPDKVR